MVVTAVFALAAATPLPFHRRIEDRPMVRSLVTVAMVAFWLFGTVLALFGLTSAYGPPGV